MDEKDGQNEVRPPEVNLLQQWIDGNSSQSSESSVINQISEMVNQMFIAQSTSSTQMINCTLGDGTNELVECTAVFDTICTFFESYLHRIYYKIQKSNKCVQELANIQCAIDQLTCVVRFAEKFLSRDMLWCPQGTPPNVSIFDSCFLAYIQKVLSPLLHCFVRTYWVLGNVMEDLNVNLLHVRVVSLMLQCVARSSVLSNEQCVAFDESIMAWIDEVLELVAEYVEPHDTEEASHSSLLRIREVTFSIIGYTYSVLDRRLRPGVRMIPNAALSNTLKHWWIIFEKLFKLFPPDDLLIIIFQCIILSYPNEIVSEHQNDGCVPEHLMSILAAHPISHLPFAFTQLLASNLKFSLSDQAVRSCTCLTPNSAELVDSLIFVDNRINREVLMHCSKLDRRRDEALRTYLARVAQLNLTERSLRLVYNIHHCSSGLRVLILDGNNISDLSGLSQLLSLERLSLQNNRLYSLVTFPLLPRLEKLCLNENDLDCLEHLQCKTPALIELHANFQRGLGIRALSRKLLQTLQRLRSLSLSANNIHSSFFLHHVASSLEALDLENNRLENLDGLLESIRHLEHIESVRLKGNPLCGPKYRDGIIVTCPSIKQIDETEVTTNTRLFLLRKQTLANGRPLSPSDARYRPKGRSALDAAPSVAFEAPDKPISMKHCALPGRKKIAPNKETKLKKGMNQTALDLSIEARKI